METSIQTILKKYESDKVCGHNYGDFYDHIFNSPKTILEIGVQYGKSIKAWCEAFPDAQVDGVDIKNQFEGDLPINFEMWVGDINDFTPQKQYDIIIDDGSHHLGDILFVVRNFPKYLKPDGKLIIEDIEIPEDYVPKISQNLGMEFQMEKFDFRGAPDDYIVVISRKPEIQNKKVSIIVPSYKYAHYLSECIATIRNQTYPVHEIIVVSDGSPDNTVQVCTDLGVRCIEKENGGLASARNAGIKVATGDYIMCLDADDKLTPGAVEEHVRLMLDDKTIAQCALMEFGDRYVVMVPTKPTGLERILKSNTIFCNAMFSKKMWEQVGGYDESEIMRLGREDHEFWIRLLEAGCEVNSSDFIALRYRVHEGQMTQATLYPNMAKIDEYFYKKHRDLYDRFGLTLNK